MRRQAAEARLVPLGALEALAGDRQWVVRAAVAARCAVLRVATADAWSAPGVVSALGGRQRGRVGGGDAGWAAAAAGTLGSGCRCTWVAGLPAAVSEVLAGDPITAVRKAVAGNRCASVPVLTALTGDVVPGVAERAVATLSVVVARSRHPGYVAAPAPTPGAWAGVLGAAAVSGAVTVRSAVAACDRLPGAVLAALATDGSPAVRAAVASHAGLPAGLLAALAGDPVPSVRAAVARREDVSVAVLEQAACDVAAAVRVGAARHRRLPQVRLWALMEDPDGRVSAAAKGVVMAALVGR